MDNAPGTRKPSLLIQILQEEFENVSFEAISRKYWNDTAGKVYGVCETSLNSPRIGFCVSAHSK
jgi:hypothetical protein